MIKQFSDMVARGMMTDDDARSLSMRYRQEVLMKSGIDIPEPKQRPDTRQWLLTVPARYSKTKKRHQITRSSREAVIEAYEQEVYSVIAHDEMTVQGAVTEYLDSRRDELKISSYERYVRMSENHIKESFFGELRLTDVTLDYCRQYIQTLYKEGLCQTHIKQLKSLVVSSLEYAIAHDYITTNYMRSVKINGNLCSAERAHDTGAWTDEEMHELWLGSISQWQNGRHFRYSAAAMFLMYSGCRVGELLSATWNDVNFEEKTLSITKTLVRYTNYDTGKKILMTDTTKSVSSRRVLRLNDAAMFWLYEMRARNEQLGIESSLLVPSRSGRLVKQDTIDICIQKFCAAIGMRYLSSHAMRRTYARVLLDANVPVSEVSHDLGHKNISTTQNIYYKRRSAEAGQMDKKNAAFSAAVGIAI